MKLLALALVACGGGQHPEADPPKWRHPGARFIEVLQSGDAVAIAANLHEPLAYGGLWFPDPACTQQFPTQRKIPRDELPAFAACLAKLHVDASKRTHTQYDIFVADYAPGFELEVQMAGARGEEKAAWIGYGARRDTADALPTITGEALAALRTDHTPPPSFDNANAKALELPYEYAWLKICLDATGAVTGVHARETTSPDAEQAMTHAAKQWTFGPFIAGGSALPVCAMTRITSIPTEDAEILPLDIPPSADGFAMISNKSAKRIAGVKLVAPSDQDKIALTQAGVEKVVATFRACFDENGAMEKVVPMKPSGLSDYDHRIHEAVMSTWRYRPVRFGGKPIKACTAITFIYTQIGNSDGQRMGKHPLYRN